MKDEIIDRWQASDGAWLAMRCMRPNDGAGVKQSLNQLSPTSRRRRFFSAIAEFSDERVRQLVEVDLDKAYPLVVLRASDGIATPIAGGRFVREGDSSDCSFSVLVSDEWQRQGIGRRLLTALLREASRRGLRRMYGQVLADNEPMLRLARALHFVVIEGEEADAEDGVLNVVCDIPGDWSRQPRRILRKIFPK